MHIKMHFGSVNSIVYLVTMTKRTEWVYLQSRNSTTHQGNCFPVQDMMSVTLLAKHIAFLVQDNMLLANVSAYN